MARSTTADTSGSAELIAGSDRDSPVLGYRPRSSDVLATSASPGDVLTDVLFQLTFDNTAYVEEVCNSAEASGLLPDSLPGHSPSVLIRFPTCSSLHFQLETDWPHT